MGTGGGQCLQKLRNKLLTLYRFCGKLSFSVPSLTLLFVSSATSRSIHIHTRFKKSKVFNELRLIFKSVKTPGLAKEHSRGETGQQQGGSQHSPGCGHCCERRGTCTAGVLLRQCPPLEGAEARPPSLANQASDSLQIINCPFLPQDQIFLFLLSFLR